MPKVPQLETCCCCCSTECGSKIIGWLSAISAIIVALGVAITLPTMIQHVGEAIPTQDGKTVKIEVQDVVQSCVVLALAIFCAVLAILLLVGISKKNMSYVRMWLTWSTVYMIFVLILLIYSIFRSIVHGGAGTSSMTIVNFIIYVYCVLVVYSYYREQRQTTPGNY